MEYAVDPGQWFTVLGVGVAHCKDGVLLYGVGGQQGSCHAVRYCFLVISRPCDSHWGKLVGAVSSLRMAGLIHRLVFRSQSRPGESKRILAACGLASN